MNKNLFYSNGDDISYEQNNTVFIYKVSALIIKNNQLLMCTNNNVTFHYTIGGRVRFGETSEQALKREVFEEIGINLEIDRLGFIHENFFRIGADRIPAHEIALHYYMKNSPLLDGVCASFKDGPYINYTKWFDINDLNKQHIYPEFLQTYLLAPKQEVIKIVTKGWGL